jgi:hypothetical protein
VQMRGREMALPEAGGPTTQSGIFYQNSIAALYLGRLLDSRPTPNGQRVVNVRLEAPEEVDDVVVTYENGMRLLIQAKEALAVGTAPWTAFWRALRIQHARDGGGAERYKLAVGNLTTDLDQLRELCDRSQGKETASEWIDALAATHRAVLGKVLEAAQVEVTEAFALARRLTVEFQTLHHIETVGIRDAIPASSVTLENLFTALRDACGGAARVRASFDTASLLDRLATTHGITITGGQPDGLLSYLSALELKYGDIIVPGTPFRGPLDDLLGTPTIEVTNLNDPGDFEDESYSRPRSSAGESIELSSFPRASRKHLLLEAGAGFGKSTLLQAVLMRLARERVFVPAYVSADGLASSYGILNYLERHLNLNYRVTLDWTALCRQGRAVLLIDGLDELADQARTTVLGNIEQVAAMFPAAPILIAARDRSALSLPQKFTRCRIMRLSETQGDDLLKRYLSRRPEVAADTVKTSLKRSTDLSSLCTIPLFLALLVATLPSSGQLPRSRSELLERYLSFALAPQRHKSGSQPSVSITNLRRAAEALAIDDLRRHEVAQAEDAARRMLGVSMGQALADDCIDDLLQCGLLVRRGARIGFPIATVQEYLAGCALSAGEPEIEAWFRQIARRPWAQAVQFALERMPNSEPALIAQIDRADDLFHTSLRVIARSVVNGGRASPEFRRKIVERLLAVWETGGWRVQRDVAELLADGLAIPPTSELINLLVTTGDEVSQGMLLVKLGDRDVALRAFKSLLKQEDIRSLWSSSWIDAIRMIGPSAIPLLLARSLQPGFIADQVIADILYRLRGMESVNWAEISERKDLPRQVVVASLWGAGRQDSAAGRQMISSFLVALADEAAQEPTSDTRPWQEFPQAYLSTSWWPDHLVNVVVGSAGSEKQRANIFDTLINVPYDAASNGTLLVEEILRLVASSTKGEVLFAAAVCAASFQDSASEAEVLSRLSTELSSENLQIWAMYYPYFSEGHKIEALEIIKEGLRGAVGESDFISIIMMHVDYCPGDSRHVGVRGPFRASDVQSMSRDIIIEWAGEFVSKLPDGANKLLFTCRIVEAGGVGAATLVEALEAFAAQGVSGDRDDWTWVATAMDAVERAGHSVSTDVMLRLVKLFPEFPTHSFFAKLVRREGRAVADQIVALFSEAGSKTRSQIISGLEDEAQSLGIAVSRDAEGGLRLDWVE